MNRSNKAFTLLETLVVLSVIGIIVLIASVLLSDSKNSASLVVIEQSVEEVELQIQMAAEEETLRYITRVDVESLLVAADEGELYSKRGHVSRRNDIAFLSVNKGLSADYIDEELEYYRVPDEYLLKAGVNINGSFYYDENLKGYYSKIEAKEKENSLKSITILPYSLWDMENVMNEVKRMELNTVNLGIRAEISDIHSNEVILNNDDLSHAIKLSKKLKKENIKIMIEPFPWIADGSIAETELNPENIDTWFWNWKEEIIVPIIEKFNDSKVDIDYFTIASNFVHLEYAHGYWDGVLSRVDELSPESLTIYKTNWWITASWDSSSKKAFNSKLNSPLFKNDKLDIISIATYFELTDKEEPTYEEIKEAIRSTTVHNRSQNVYEEIKAVSSSNNGKQIIFGELGVPRAKGYAKEPWNNYYSSDIVEDAQYNYFRAYLEEFWSEDWFKGFTLFASGDKESLYDIKDEKAVEYLKYLK